MAGQSERSSSAGHARRGAATRRQRRGRVRVAYDIPIRKWMVGVVTGLTLSGFTVLAADPFELTDGRRLVCTDWRRRHPLTSGAALLRRRPNQSLRQRGRRQLDPSRRGEGAAEGTGGRWYLCRQRRLGVFRWYSRAWWRVSVRINAPAARGGLRTVATAAKCHRAPVDYHPVAGQMPTGLQ